MLVSTVLQPYFSQYSNVGRRLNTGRLFVPDIEKVITEVSRIVSRTCIVYDASPDTFFFYLFAQYLPTTKDNVSIFTTTHSIRQFTTEPGALESPVVKTVPVRRRKWDGSITLVAIVK